jgi:hypothetical protein
MMSGKVRAVAVWAATALVAAWFFFVGVVLLIAPQEFEKHLREWGYPEWLRYVVAAASMAGAVLLFVPRLGWLGAAILAAVVAGYIYTQATHSQTEQTFGLVVLLLALLCLTYLRWPRRAPPPVKNP